MLVARETYKSALTRTLFAFSRRLPRGIMSDAPHSAPPPSDAAPESPSAGSSAASPMGPGGPAAKKAGFVARVRDDALSRWRAVVEALHGARGELAFFAYGLALLWLNAFNDYHGLALSTKLPYLRLDVGYLFIAAAALLLLTRAQAPAGRVYGGAARVGLAVMLAGSAAEVVCHLGGLLGGATVGGVFLPDLAVLGGGALLAWSAIRAVLPPGPLARVGVVGLLLGLVAAVVYAYLARAPFFAAFAAQYSGGAEATIFGGVEWLLNPSAAGVAVQSGAHSLVALARDAGLAASTPHLLIGYGAAFAVLGAAAIAIAAAWRGRSGEPNSAADWNGLFIVVVVGALLYLPTLGAFDFYDPWEGHYAEVARQMIWRDDWVSLYWENNWFWSKPVGIFWMMAVSFKGFGVSDLVARLPFALTGLAGMVFVFYFCRKLWSARAGVISAVVLGTLPQYLFISRQVMTDVPVVVLTIVGVGCLILALFAREDDEVERRPLTVFFTLLFAATTLPQFSMIAAELERYGVVQALLYVLPWIALVIAMSRARKARQIYAYAFYLSIGLGCLAKGLIAPGLPVLVLFAYLVVSGEWGDLFSARRLGRGFVVSALVAAIGVLLVKGVYKLPGNELLVTVAVTAAFVGLLFIGATAKGGVWDRLEVKKGLLIFALAALPWYVAMAARHGGAVLDASSPAGFRLTGFLHEFFIQHHFDRLGGGVHGDTGTTFEYFIRWGAYAMFPWVAFVPAALSRFWSGRRELDLNRDSRAKLFVFLWFAVFFTLFTLSATKFHHYILPALPPLAIMIGVWLDRAADDEREITRPILVGGIAILLFVGLDLLRVPQTFFNMFTYVFSGRTYPWPTAVMPEPFLRLMLFTLCAVLAAGAMPRPRWLFVPRRMVLVFGAIFLVLAAGVVLVQVSPTSMKLQTVAPDRIGAYRDALASVMPMPPTAMVTDYAQNVPHDRFWQYAGKLYGRLGEFGLGRLAAFAGILAMVCFWFIGRRRLVMTIFAGLAIVFGGWCAHWYMVELGPHSGQRHLWDAYYQRRAGPEEKLCAYMMNWRSEHWYSHNEVIVGLSDPPLVNMARAPGRQWIITERGRIGDVKSLLQQRNQICRGVFEWDNISNRYALLSVEDAPNDPQVQQCLQKRGGK